MQSKYTTALLFPCLILLFASCGFQGRKYTHGYWMNHHNSIETSIGSKSENSIQNSDLRLDTIIPESKPVPVPLPLPLPQSKDTLSSSPSSSSIPQQETPPVYHEEYNQKSTTPEDEAVIEKKISNTLKADFATWITPFIGWGMLRLFFLNNTLYSVDSTILLLFFTIATLLAMGYIVSFVLGLVWGFEAKSKLQKLYQNHPLYEHWKERNSWSIILAFLGLLAPIISFILFLVSFNF
jgi:hypothetical protein